VRISFDKSFTTAAAWAAASRRVHDWRRNHWRRIPAGDRHRACAYTHYLLEPAGSATAPVPTPLAVS